MLWTFYRQAEFVNNKADLTKTSIKMVFFLPSLVGEEGQGSGTRIVKGEEAVEVDKTWHNLA